MVEEYCLIRGVYRRLLTAKESHMRRTSKTECRIRRSPRLVSYRPMLELLEDRLPLGDVLLGWGLLGSRLGQSTALGADSPRMISSQAETRFGHDAVAHSSTLIASQSSHAGSALPFNSILYPWQEERNHAAADLARAQNEGVVQNRSAYRDLAGLNEDVLDRLIANDFDALLSLPSSSHGSHKAGIAGVADIENKASATREGGTNAGGGGRSPAAVQPGGSSAAGYVMDQPALAAGYTGSAGVQRVSPLLGKLLLGAAGRGAAGQASSSHGQILPYSPAGVPAPPVRLSNGPGTVSPHTGSQLPAA